jgi:predicted nucleic acid-binding protein
VAVLIDSSILVRGERAGLTVASLIGEVVAADEPAAIAAITASELLVGAMRARTEEQRVRRQAFVDGILSAAPVLPFDLQAARVHARLTAYLQETGTPVGSHDLLIGATAIAHGYAVLTENVREFRRLPGLEVRGAG